MVQFYCDEKPHYEYPPVDISREEFDKWYSNVMDLNKHMTWVTNLYWYLEDYSCVLVPRNNKWFVSVYPEFKELWETILKERVSGFEHRKPKKNKKTPALKNIDNETKTHFVDMNLPPQNIIIRVRTESFDKTMDESLDELV